MVERYPSKGVLTLDDLPLREDFLKGGIDPKENDRMTIGVHRLDSAGVPSIESWFDLKFIHAQMLSLSQDERVQYVLNSEDDGKAYFFGRTHQMYSVSGFLIDSDISASQRQAMVQEGYVSGNTVSLWNSVYDKYVRAGECARQRLIVAISWRGNKFWGYVLGNNVAGTADNDNIATTSITFFSVRDDLVGVLPLIKDRRISEKPFQGLLTRQGLNAFRAIQIPTRYEPIPLSKLKKKTKGRGRVPG